MSHDHFRRASWRWLRLGALLTGIPVALVAVTSVGVLWRLSRGPLDVTDVASRWTPVSIQASRIKGHPAGRLTWDRVWLAWRPPTRGDESGLEIRASGLKILRQDGTVTLQVRDATAVFAVSGLLHGMLLARSIAAHEGQVTLRRAMDGSVDFDWPGAWSRPGGRNALSVRALSRIDLSGIDATLLDAAHARPLKVSGLGAVLSRARHGSRNLLWSGTIAGELHAPDGAVAHLAAHGALEPAGARWNLGLGPVEPAAFSSINPLLARWHAPLRINVSCLMVQTRMPGVIGRRFGLAFDQLRGRATLGAGQILQDSSEPLAVAGGSAALRLSATNPGQRNTDFDISEATMRLLDHDGRETRFAARAHFRISDLLHPKVIDGDARASSSDLHIADLGAIWPTTIMKGARRWVSRNLTSGDGHGLFVHAVLHGEYGWQSVQPIRMEGGIHLEHTTVHWLRPVVPAEDVAADIGFDGPNTLRIDFLRGAQPADDRPNAPRLLLGGGVMRIEGLFDRDQKASISLNTTGGLDGFLRLLAVPRLHLLSRHPLPFRNPSGHVSSSATLTLPLSAHIRNEDMHVVAHAEYRDVMLENVLLGRSVTNARGSLDATEKGLSLSGTGELGGIPTRTRLEEDFQGGAPQRVRERIHAEAVFDENGVARAQLGPGGLFEGYATLVTDYVSRADGNADVRLRLDLKEAGLVIPVWEKPSGQAAVADARILLRNGTLTGLEGIEAQGPAISLHGRGEVREGHVRALVLQDFRIGRSTGDARVTLAERDGGPIRVAVHAEDLDLAPLVHPELAPHHARFLERRRKGRPSSPSPTSSDGAWIVDMKTRRLFYGRDDWLGEVSAHLYERGNRLQEGAFSARLPAQVSIVLSGGRHGRHLHGQVDSLGDFLAGTHLTDRLGGGRATLDGQVGEGGRGTLPPFDGALDIGAFDFRNPPTALTAASHLSLFDWSSANGERFEVHHLHLPVRVVDDVATIRDGHLGNTALGATLKGNIGLMDGALKLQGTVVPVFAINAAPGRLPGVGRLFSPEKGGGFLAATFTVGGFVSKPALKLNPFTMLLPGVMRRLAE